MKTKKLILLILWAAFTFAAPFGLILAEFIIANSWDYRLSLAGLVVIIALFFVYKAQFVKRYQSKMNELLEELASTPHDRQDDIKKRLHRHKVIFHIIHTLDSTLPLLVLMLATSWFGRFLTNMSGIIGWVWLSVMIGAAFGIWRKVLPRGGSK